MLFPLALILGTLPNLISAAPVLPTAAEETGRRQHIFASYYLPTGPWRGGEVPAERLEGQIQQIAWRVTGTTGTLALLAPLRAELERTGYEILFECETRACGGFDFRYTLDILPEPEMHVDLGDFRFLSARRDRADGGEAVSLLISRSSARGYIQMVHVAAAPAAVPDDVRLSSMSPTAFANEGAKAENYAFAEGAAVALEGLEFATGAAQLSGDPAASVARLADFLRQNPGLHATLVGHSDASGSLSANLDLSRRRAEAVQEQLVREHGIPRSQLSAEGVGYLAPRDDNLTEAGQARNRRVEALITAR